MTLAMVFPGQGSQSVGMQAELADAYEVVRDTYREASDLLGYDLWQLVQDGPAEKLDQTTVTQPAMLAAGVATWRVWQAAGGPTPSHMAGHSLGGYTALVCAGSLRYSDAVPLVQRRAQLMQEAVPPDEAAMAAILGLDDDAILELCMEASGIGVAEAVNFNSPGQVVISGHAGAVSRAVDRAKEQGARRAIMLNVSVPSHSSLMRGAGEALFESLQTTEFVMPTVPVLSSVAVRQYRDVDDIRDVLRQQVFSPVQWVKTTRALSDAGTDRIIECGPGKVLAGLCRRIDKSVPALCVDTPAALQKALEDG